MKKQKIERHYTNTSVGLNETTENRNFSNNTQTKNKPLKLETMEKQNFSIKNFIDSLEKREFTKEQAEYVDNNKKNFRELGYNCTDSNLVDKRSIFASTIAADQQLKSEGFQKPNNILNYCKNYEDLVCSCKVPVVEELNPQWLGEASNITISDPSITGLYFTPSRLGAVLNVSKMFFNQSENMENELISMMNNELENKLISTIFTDYQNQSDSDPVLSGIFNSSNEVSYTGIGDIIEMPYDVELNSGLGYYVISPKAKKEILKLDSTAFNNTTFYGERYIIEPLMKDGLIGYVDLSKLIVCSWNYIDITIDNQTKAHKGENLIYLTGYYDFKLVSNDCARWLDLGD